MAARCRGSRHSCLRVVLNQYLKECEVNVSIIGASIKISMKIQWSFLSETYVVRICSILGFIASVKQKYISLYAFLYMRNTAYPHACNWYRRDIWWSLDGSSNVRSVYCIPLRLNFIFESSLPEKPKEDTNGKTSNSVIWMVHKMFNENHIRGHLSSTCLVIIANEHNVV